MGSEEEAVGDGMGRGISKASPRGVAHPRLMTFFAIEQTKGPTTCASLSSSGGTLTTAPYIPLFTTKMCTLHERGLSGRLKGGFAFALILRFFEENAMGCTTVRRSINPPPKSPLTQPALPTISWGNRGVFGFAIAIIGPYM